MLLLVSLVQNKHKSFSLHEIVSQICFHTKDSGAFLEHRVAGLRRVRVQGKDFSNHPWGYQVISF